MKRGLMMLVTVAVVGGCAGQQRQNFIHARAGEYVYEQPIEKVWPHVHALLAEQGYAYKQDASKHLLVTEWKEEMGSSTIAASYTRYLVEGQKLDDTHCRVRFVKHTMSQGGGAGAYETSSARHAASSVAQANNVGGTRTRASSGVRDLHAEWLLMQRVAPEDAEELLLDADEQFR